MYLPSFTGNWVDFIILLVLIFFIYQSLLSNFWSIVIDFVSFLLSLLISLKAYVLMARILENNFSFHHSIANAVGFLVTAIALEFILSFIFSFLISKLPPRILKNNVTKVLGVLLSLGQGLILISFVLTLAISMPINPNIKTDISRSKIGGLLLTNTLGIEKGISNIFGGAINDSLTHLIIEPKSKESLPLENSPQNLTVDKKSEEALFALVNDERTKKDIKRLVWSDEVATVARDYARKMWNEHFFGHYDNEGKDVGDRLTNAKVRYSYAGENLALAPTVEIAHKGLMDSKGHRENILEPKFKKIGVGVIDNGFYGKIFVQVFTD